jgi:HPt (histidine-containing phosphotransfer) domain-containing protein
MQDYITKPVDPEKLYATLARWMGKAMPARAQGSAPKAELAPLPGLAGIDSSFGLRNVGGNSALYVELLDRFRASQRDAGCSIRSDLEAGRLREAASRAHSLRGVAGNIGARALQSLSQEIEEEAGRPAPDAAALERSAAALERAVADLMDALDTYFANAPEVPAAVPYTEDAASPEDAQQAVAQLERLLAEFSGEATDYFDTVRAPLGRLLGPGALARLEAHLSRYEFEEARAVLAQAHGASSSIAEHI